jgi:hypothetical protein
MKPDWAEDNLQTIRTLMERSAIYRRALAPIMLFAGTLGVAAAAVGLVIHMNSMRAFGMLWMGTAVIAVSGAFLIARRQALKEKEPFWSPPTRRVGQAMCLPLAAGLCLGAIPTVLDISRDLTLFVALIWALFYGCALHAAGFFMPRGIRFFGILISACSCGLFCAFSANWIKPDFNPHWFMGFFFGVLHLIYGVYLYLTEKGKNAA